jgi:hypothetical protein
MESKESLYHLLHIALIEINTLISQNEYGTHNARIYLLSRLVHDIPIQLLNDGTDYDKTLYDLRLKAIAYDDTRHLEKWINNVLATKDLILNFKPVQLDN